MLHGKGAVGLAAIAALAVAGFVRAGEVSDSGKPSASPVFLQPLMLQEAPATAPSAAPSTEPAPKKPLMAALSATPLGPWFDSTNINIYGYINGGYTYSASAPPNNVITGNVFNTKNEHVVLDQLALTIERTVDSAAAAKNHTFDLGGRIDMIYGYDAGTFHSNGLFDNPFTSSSNHPYYGGRYDPENQFDITQAYADLALPLGNGLDLKIGKFVTPIGYEVINPTGNAFYSHSYLFGFAIPYTHTGILGTYALNDQWSIDAGITRGWNQSVDDNNGNPDFLGGVTWKPTANDQVILNVSLGPQQAHDNHDWWTLLDLQYTHKFSDKFNVALNANYGDAPHALGTTSAQWYGAAAYAQYVLNDYATLNARGEWYNDNNGFTLGTGHNIQVYEATFGVSITPIPNNNILKNLVIRPEARLDYANHRFYDAGTDYYQFQLAIDAYFAF